MSDAAKTEATRLAPAGRACSKFVWQSRFLKLGGSSASGIRAALSFSGGRLAFLAAVLLFSRSSCFFRGRLARGIASGAGRIPRPAFRLRHADGGWPRCRRDWGSLLAAQIRRTAGLLDSRFHVPWAHRDMAHRDMGASGHGRIGTWAHRRIGGRRPFGFRGSEFVSEFETKRDQECASGLMVRKYSVAVAGSAFEARTLLMGGPSQRDERFGP